MTTGHKARVARLEAQTVAARPGVAYMFVDFRQSADDPALWSDGNTWDTLEAHEARLTGPVIMVCHHGGVDDENA